MGPFSALTHFAFRTSLLGLTSSAAIPHAPVPTAVAPMNVSSDTTPKWRGKEFLKLLPNADCDASLMQTAPKTIPHCPRSQPCVASPPLCILCQPGDPGTLRQRGPSDKRPRAGLCGSHVCHCRRRAPCGSCTASKNSLAGAAPDAIWRCRRRERLAQGREAPPERVGATTEDRQEERVALFRMQHRRAPARESFIMDGKSYPKILTAVQQATLDAAALPETPGTLRYALTKGKSTE